MKVDRLLKFMVFMMNVLGNMDQSLCGDIALKYSTTSAFQQSLMDR